MSIYAYTLPQTNSQKSLNHHKNEVLKCRSLELLYCRCCCFHHSCSCCCCRHCVCVCVCVCMCMHKFFQVPPQNSGCQKGDMKCLPYWQCTNIRRQLQHFLSPWTQDLCSLCVCLCVCTVRDVCTHTQINLRTDFKSVTSHQIVEWKVNMNDWMDIIPSTLCIN